MRLSVSHTYFNKKLDELGQGHDATVCQMLDVQKKILQKKIHQQDPEPVSRQDQLDDSDVPETPTATIFEKRLALIAAAPLPNLDVDFSIPVLRKCHRKCIIDCKHFT
jgi:hypothetical protein